MNIEQVRIVENQTKLEVLSIPICSNCFSKKMFVYAQNIYDDSVFVQCGDCKLIIIFFENIKIFIKHNEPFGVKYILNEDYQELGILRDLIYAFNNNYVLIME